MILPYQIPIDAIFADAPEWVAFVNYDTGEPITPLPEITDPSGQGFWVFHYDPSTVEAAGRVRFKDGSLVAVYCTRESERIVGASQVLRVQIVPGTPSTP